MKYKYYPMHMHLHACHDYGGSMEGHIANAKLLGMEYIRFTDHDSRVGYKDQPVNSFDFSRRELVYEDYPGMTCGFSAVGEPDISFADGCMIISSNGDEAGVIFSSKGKRHTVSLLAGVTLTLGLKKTNDKGRVVVDVTLSQHPETDEEGNLVHVNRHIIYVLGDAKEGELPLSVSDDGIYILNLSEDVFSVNAGGLDNAFCTLSVLADGGACCEFFKMEIDRKYSAQEVQDKQREVANEIGKRYGVKPFVTTEISQAGQHKCVYGEQVPIIDYAAHNFSVTAKEAIAVVKKHNGIFAYNHPFDRFKRMELTDEEKANIAESEADNLAKENVYGATLMEIGFPYGRSTFSFENHLRLWDLLSLAGVFITGHGDNDSHRNEEGWLEGNNFAAYIAAPGELEFPIDDKVFIESMKAGNVYTGDPVQIKGKINFECDSKPMGAIIKVKDSETKKMRFTADSLQKGWKLRIIFNGELYKEFVIDSEDVDTEFEIKASEKANFARIELYNDKDHCILLTNPIYLVRDDFEGQLPDRRMYRDEKYFNSEYEDEIKLPDGFENAKGTKILHLGDTSSECFPFYRKLIEVVKPDIILHTGDLVDEVKAGRIPEVADEYRFKAKFMIDIMKNSGARLIITPGNNDLTHVISEFAPQAEIYETDTVINLGGMECRIGHAPTEMTHDKDWSFYGHTLRYDVWDEKDNAQGKHCRFNAVKGPFVCTPEDVRFYRFESPEKY